MKVKHIIMIRFLSRQFSGPNVLLDDTIKYRLNYLTSNVITTLNNQINLDFELVLLINPDLNQDQKNTIAAAVVASCPKFKFSLVPHDKNIGKFFNQFWDGTDYVALTRMDDDDFVTKHAVQDLRDYIEKNPDLEFVAVGYKHGYKYTEGNTTIQKYTSGHVNGHIAIFQTFIYNTAKIKYSEKILPYTCRHTDVLGSMNKKGYQCKIVHLDREDSFIYFRHKLADSYQRNSANKNPIPITNELLNQIKDEFGFILNIGESHG